MSARKKPNAFLTAMQEAESLSSPPAPTAVPRAGKSGAPQVPSRAGLKHIGGYLDRDTVEKVAILRARLNCDNSQLLKRAVEDLYRKHEAKRSFGDA